MLNFYSMDRDVRGDADLCLKWIFHVHEVFSRDNKVTLSSADTLARLRRADIVLVVL